MDCQTHRTLLGAAFVADSDIFLGSMGSYDWLDFVQFFPLEDSGGRHIHEGVVHLPLGADDCDISDSGWTRNIGSILQPSAHVGLAGFQQSDGLIEELAVGLLDDVDGPGDLLPGERVPGVRETV